MPKREVVPNRVFVGYPWKTYRPYWEPLLRDLHAAYPLHFLAMGRDPGEPAAQLLVKILNAINTSSMALFDGSTGNPNVSLEYGYAKSVLPENDLYLFADEDSLTTPGPGSPIIADLAGTIANRYKMGDRRLKDALTVIAARHPYSKRYDKFCRQRKYKGGPKKLLLRLFRKFDGQPSILRRELLDDLVHDTRKDERHIDNYLKALHEGGLITITRGNEYSSRVFLVS
jgi:hypothetical protein